MIRRLLVPVMLAVAAIAVVAGCSFSAGTGVSVDKEALAQEVSDKLKDEVGRAPESVTCPDNLKGEVGATMRCELEDGGQIYGVTVEVTKVDGTDVKFDMKVDDEPQ